MRKARTLLADLQETLARETEALESKLLPFELARGISSIPDSILSRILEIECVPDFPSHLIEAPQVSLSLVCRRFRDVISNSPRIWSKIHAWGLDLDTISIFLERSKAADLDIQLQYASRSGYEWSEPQEQRNNKFLCAVSAIIPHAQRWESLKLDFSNVGEAELFDITKRLNHLPLPRLHTLDIVYTNPVSEDYTAEQDPSRAFFETLEMPTLYTLRLCNAVPEPFAAPLLTSLALDLTKAYVDVGKLARFLSATPTLEDVTLRLFYAWAYGSRDVVVVELVNVKTLELHLGDTPLDRLYRFREALRTPNIRKIVLKVEHDDFPGYRYEPYGRDDVHDSCDDEGLTHQRSCDAYLKFTLCHESYPHLEEFSYRHYGDNGDKYTLPLQKMPNLCTLKLDTGALPDDRWLYKVPPLRELFIRWDRKHGLDLGMWLWALNRQMREQDTLSALEKLIIDRVDGALERQTERLFGERVVWESWD